MTRRQLIERLETTLRRRRDALRRSFGGELSQLRASEQSGVGDPVDAALDAEYAEINSELAETEGRELSQIEHALRLIGEGRYGVCEGCGRSIPVARLEAVPHATMCIQCQKSYEKYRATGQRLNDRAGGEAFPGGFDSPSLSSA